MLRPVRTVRVTTKEELDAALATAADQVIVEGDDDLLTYAVNTAAENIYGIVRENGRREVVVRINAPNGAAGNAVVLHDNIARPEGGRKSGLAVATLLGLGVVAIGWFWFGKALNDNRSQVVFQPSGPATPPTPESSFWANFPSLLWPLVSIVAIIALFLIAQQAISSGSNVTISWKVTEKVSGRVVITKVRERPSRDSKAA